jgi:hypothetical protein
MAKASPRQRKTAGRVMHEFKHGELKSGRGGRGGKVKSRKQAIAIALKESGESKYESKSANKRNFAKAKRDEKRGTTGQQRREGKSHVGASGRRESSRAVGGRNATSRTAAGRKAAATRKRAGTATRARSGGVTKAQLYARAKRAGVQGRSRMSKRQLQNALR